MDNYIKNMFDIDSERINTGGKLGAMRDDWTCSREKRKVEVDVKEEAPKKRLAFSGYNVSAQFKKAALRVNFPRHSLRRYIAIVSIVAFLIAFIFVGNLDIYRFQAKWQREYYANREAENVTDWVDAEELFSNEVLINTIKDGVYDSFVSAIVNNRIAAPVILKFVNAGEIYCTASAQDADNRNMLIEVFKVTGENDGEVFDYYWYVKFTDFRNENGNIYFNGGEYDFMQTAKFTFGDLVVSGSATMDDLLTNIGETEDLSDYKIEVLAFSRI